MRHRTTCSRPAVRNWRPNDHLPTRFRHWHGRHSGRRHTHAVGRQRLAGRRCQKTAGRDHRRTADRLSGKRHGARDRHRRARRAEVEVVGPLGGRAEAHRATGREAARAPEEHRRRRAGQCHAHRRGRGAHRTRVRARRLRLSLWRCRAAQLQLVVAQRALRGGAEHRRLPGNSQHAGRTAHGYTPRRRGRVPGADGGLCRSDRRRDRASQGSCRAEGHRAGFPARQDAQPGEDRARRRHRAVVAGDLGRQARQRHGRDRTRGEDRERKSRARARPADRRARSASPPRDLRGGRVETAARR